MKLLKHLRGPFWYARNIAVACWMFNLRDMAEKPGQKPLKRFAYRLVVTLESLLEAVFMFTLIQFMALFASVVLPSRWAFLEIRETWFPFRP